MMNIARFNGPFYLVALVVLILSLAGSFLFSGTAWRIGCSMVFAFAVYFSIGSLAVSHLVYDRSDLYRWNWLDRALRGCDVRRAVFCHCGFDEASADLRQRFGAAKWQVLDHYDVNLMTEASIRRARAMVPPPPDTLKSPYNAWTLESGTADVVFALLAIHELRSEMERSAWFQEAARCLSAGGRLLLVEHVRDSANFIAFGPGFFHFHSPASWRKCWESAGFRSADAFRLTPFVRVFVLVKL